MANEYVGNYEVRRIMHARPCAEVALKVTNLLNNYKGMCIKLQVLGGHDEFEGDEFLQLLKDGISTQLGSNIEVKVSGDFSQEILRDVADDVGRLFQIKSDERPLQHRLHKMMYGYFPDEEPQKNS